MDKGQATVKTKAKSFEAVGTNELAYFFEQLAMYAKSGISTMESLYIMQGGKSKALNGALIATLCEYVSEGMYLSQAMTLCGCFPEYALGMTDLGEQTGRFEEVCRALSQYYRNRDVLRKNVRSSIAYPLFMAAMVLVVIFVLLVQVMPVFEQVFNQLGLGLNPVSAGLLNFGQALSGSAVYIAAAVALIIIVALVMRSTASGKRSISRMYERSFVTRKLAEAEAANRFAFSMSLMLMSGIDTTSCLEFAYTTAENEIAQTRIADVMQRMEQGESLSDSILASGIVGSEYYGVMEAGSRAGSFGEVLSSVAESYYDDTMRRTQSLLGVIEPAMVALLCVTVGMIMLSVMLPLAGIMTGL